MTKKILLFVSLFGLFTLSAAAQERIVKRPQKSTPAPGAIKLLDGYVHTRLQGIDSIVGSINKEGRLNIGYDIGIMAGEYANRCQQNDSCVWYKEQQLNAGVVKISLQSNGFLVATFPRTKANFFTKAVNDEDVAEFLMMILTFDETQCCQNTP